MEGYEVVEGNLHVQAIEGVDPSGLRGLREITGTLSVGRPEVDGRARQDQREDPLDGLQGLLLANAIVLRGVTLPNLAGLSALVRVKSHFSIENCRGLLNLSGLDQLEEAESLVLDRLPALEGLAGASRLQRLSSLNIAVAPRLLGLESLGFAPLLPPESP